MCFKRNAESLSHIWIPYIIKVSPSALSPCPDLDLIIDTCNQQIQCTVFSNVYYLYIGYNTLLLYVCFEVTLLNITELVEEPRRDKSNLSPVLYRPITYSKDCII